MNEVQTSSIPGDRPAERSDSFIDDDADFVKLFVGQVSAIQYAPFLAITPRQRCLLLLDLS